MNAYGKICYTKGYKQAVADMEGRREAERQHDQAVFTYYLIQKLAGLIFIVLSYVIWRIEPVAFLVTMPLTAIGAYMLITSDRVVYGYPEDPDEI